MARGTRHSEITIVSEPEDGFPYYSARCECSWTSVKHHRRSGAEAEATYHNVGRTGSQAPKDPR